MIEYIFRRFPLLRAFYIKLLKNGFKLFHDKSGKKIMNAEWDNLIILDACRFEHFSKVNDIPGKLEKVASLGSHTPEWMQENFSGRHGDTVCVAGNPYYSEPKLKEMFGRNPFHHVEDVWDYGWDEELGTVPPQEVTDAALKIRKEYPSKRILVHYMQPHCPFVNRTDLNKFMPLIEDPDKSNILRRKILESLASISPEIEGLWKHKNNPWNAVKKGEIGIDEFREGHLENLNVVLKEAKKLVDSLDGRTIITSDHGELFGEFWMYGHPESIRVKPLIEVPWFEASLGGD